MGECFGQNAYFIDGYHGGVYGHYPNGYTQFLVKKLQEYPYWKVNLEIEPETWDSVWIREPESLKQLQAIFADQSSNGRIEYVSPAYGQSYFFNVSGESIIRHFSYGMKKVRQYFPEAVFTAYSSEEPCFTSALPQILKSFGYKYASLKNPNTCWGGYTRAYGGELVNWIGPDGTKIITSPRYATEGLLPGSTWQTEGWTNSRKYIKDALAYGIKNPVAMTLQDAGWRNGPWIGNGNRGYQPTYYTTWRQYFENYSIKEPQQDWKFTQEDVLVSLVWGSQVMQKLAQQVRASENNIVMAEKVAAMSSVYEHKPWPQSSIDEAWRTLMLSQHHDCWIVPYNGRKGDTWADKVKKWTTSTNQISDSIIQASVQCNNNCDFIRVYNTTGTPRKAFVKLRLPQDFTGGEIEIVDEVGKIMPLQADRTDAKNAVYFQAEVPAFGFASYRMNKGKATSTHAHGATGYVAKTGEVVLETDYYKIILDPLKGGAIKSLVAKKLDNKEFVDIKNARKFNELRGSFFDNGGFLATSDNPATVSVIENGPFVVKAEVKGMLLNHPYSQTITLKQGERLIDCSLKIDWKNNVGIGDDYKQKGGLDGKDYRKPFYNDSKKLLALFPVNFASQQIYKNAPFDVTESKLGNTFFSTWDSIKNNIILNWVDVYDSKNNIGLALFSDHTTTYAHGEDFPLALNVQYSGAGLWGRNHTITSPTEIRYALVPHKGKWDEGGISDESLCWEEPLVAKYSSGVGNLKRSLLDLRGTGYQVTTTLIDGKDLLVRLFNADGDEKEKKIIIGVSADSAQLEELNGKLREKLVLRKNGAGIIVQLNMPRFGIRTVRLKNVGEL
ncbi:MAG: glycoside hydrolase family 38 C-terminal domain-containing protein [Niabella sp.]